MVTRFSSASVPELMQGYSYQEATGMFCCLHCAKQFHQDEIYAVSERFLTASAAIAEHVATEHGDPLTLLLQQDRKATGLTEHQQLLYGLLAEGFSDKEVAKRLQVSASTIRHHRFTLREKTKVTRLQMALFELLEQAMQSKRHPDPTEELLEIPEASPLVDDRYFVTVEEEQKILKSAFTSLAPLQLRQIPSREKRKIVVLRKIAAEFVPGRKYTEREINEVLRTIHEDFSALRRYLIDYRIMQRTPDGASYWLHLGK